MKLTKIQRQEMLHKLAQLFGLSALNTLSENVKYALDQNPNTKQWYIQNLNTKMTVSLDLNNVKDIYLNKDKRTNDQILEIIYNHYHKQL